MTNTPESLEAFRACLSAPDFSHVSHRQWCGVTILWAYRRDPASPSGVMLSGSAYDGPDAEAVMREAGRRAIRGGRMGEMACRAGMAGR